jgi:hypothetical protein
MGLTRQIGAADLDARSAPRRGEERSDESSERNGSCATDARSAPRRGEERSDESNQVFGGPRSPARIQYGIEERCQSGRMGLTRNQVYGSPYRGFESHPLRQQVRPSSSLRSETVEGLFLSGVYVTLSRAFPDRLEAFRPK